MSSFFLLLQDGNGRIFQKVTLIIFGCQSYFGSSTTNIYSTSICPIVWHSFRSIRYTMIHPWFEWWWVGRAIGSMTSIQSLFGNVCKRSSFIWTSFELDYFASRTIRGWRWGTNLIKASFIHGEEDLKQGLRHNLKKMTQYKSLTEVMMLKVNDCVSVVIIQRLHWWRYWMHLIPFFKTITLVASNLPQRKPCRNYYDPWQWYDKAWSFCH